MPSDNELERLERQVESLSDEVAELRQRVAQLEGQRTLPREQNVAPVIAHARPSPAVSTNTGLKLLNRVGALTLFIGIIFFFKYAVDNEWIGAAGRVVLGIIGGLLLIAAAEWLRARAQTVFAQGLDACGIATLYISAYAACDYYHLIGSVVAFVAFLAIAAGTIWLSLKHGDAFLAALGYLSAVAAPGLFKAIDPKLLDTNVWSWFAFVYLLVIDALAFVQAATQRRMFLVPTVTVAIALEAFWLVNPSHPIACVLFFLAMAAVSFRPPRQAWRNAEIRLAGYAIGHLLVALAGLRFLFFWFDKVTSPEARRSLLSETESMLLGVYGVALLISAVVRKSAPDRVLGLAFLGVVIGKLYVVDVWVLTRFYRISAFVALGIILLASSFVYSRWKRSFES